MKNIARIAGAVALIALVWVGIARLAGTMGETDNQTFVPLESKAYSSGPLGLSFEYPASYFLEEKDLSTGERGRYLLSLTADTEENRLVREGEVPGREGPTAITVEIYQNDLDRMTARDFVVGTSDSNYKLGSGSMASTTVDGRDAVSYEWSGLYEAKAVAVSTSARIYLFTATYLAPDDQILKDFDSVLSSVRFLVE